MAEMKLLKSDGWILIEKKVSALTSSLSFRLCCFRFCRNDDVFLLLWCDGRARIRLRSLPEEERSWYQQPIKCSSETKARKPFTIECTCIHVCTFVFGGQREQGFYSFE